MMGYGTWQERKRERTWRFFHYIFGWVERKCVACNGSGIYDNTGSPPCGGCDGTGKERYPGPKRKRLETKPNGILGLKEVNIDTMLRDAHRAERNGVPHG